MKQKTFNTAAAVIFLIIAVLHAVRIAMGWTAVIGGVALPLWLSFAVVIVAGHLAYQGRRLNK